MSELEKLFKKNQIKKLKKKPENQCQNVAYQEKIISEKWKFGSYKSLELTMNGLRKPFRKKIGSKNSKKQ